jgi:hypothetical protein
MHIELSTAHRRRLREVWRSAGWPFQDVLEAELLAGGWLERRWDQAQRVTLHLTERGVHAIVDTARANRKRMSRHEELVERVARQMHLEGRVVWRGVALRAALPGESLVEGAPVEVHEPTTRWVMAVPDVFSVRHTSRPEYLEPVAHEVKVNRADLLSDLRNPDKAQAYRRAAGQCWYVIQEGIGEPEEIPADFGVMIACAERLVLARSAPRIHQALTFSTWMTLARATPVKFQEQDQSVLGGRTCGEAELVAKHR